MCVPTHLVVKGTDVQRRISWCVLRTHVCAIEEKVLQMLHMSIPASLWRDTLISLLLYNLAVSGKHSMQTFFFFFSFFNFPTNIFNRLSVTKMSLSTKDQSFCRYLKNRQNKENEENLIKTFCLSSSSAVRI